MGRSEESSFLTPQFAVWAKSVTRGVPESHQYTPFPETGVAGRSYHSRTILVTYVGTALVLMLVANTLTYDSSHEPSASEQ